MEVDMILMGTSSISMGHGYFPWQTVSHNQRVALVFFA
jgi:hypothetical protein